MMMASWNGHAAVVDQLLAHQAQVNLQNYVCTTYLSTYLSTYISIFRSANVICWLDRYGFAWQRGMTALALAASEGRATVVDQFLKHQAQVDTRENVNKPPCTLCNIIERDFGNLAIHHLLNQFGDWISCFKLRCLKILRRWKWRVCSVRCMCFLGKTLFYSTTDQSYERHGDDHRVGQRRLHGCIDICKKLGSKCGLWCFALQFGRGGVRELSTSLIYTVHSVIVATLPISISAHYGDLRRQLGVVAFNRLINPLEFNNIRCRPLFDNSYWISLIQLYNENDTIAPTTQPSKLQLELLVLMRRFYCSWYLLNGCVV